MSMKRNFNQMREKMLGKKNDIFLQKFSFNLTAKGK